MDRKRVGILVFPQVEVLDFCGPFEVFSVARLDEQRRREESSPFEVQLVAQTADVVSAIGGLRVIPDTTIDECPILDVLVVPGGWAGAKRDQERASHQLDRRARPQSRDADIRLYGRDAARAGRAPRWSPCDDALALPAMDARVLS
jgi:putative intracellular protease/amidase